ncbi:MAG: hypothetical protein VKN60_03930 [Cyanobacteriota bacterium]|nr:hypothetical protein [Cyanobacteriota bacterium]
MKRRRFSLGPKFKTWLFQKGWPWLLLPLTVWGTRGAFPWTMMALTAFALAYGGRGLRKPPET